MSHELEFRAIKDWLKTAQEEAAYQQQHLSVIVPICLAVQALANIVEANERGHISDTERPPAAPTEPGDLSR